MSSKPLIVSVDIMPVVVAGLRALAASGLPDVEWVSVDSVEQFPPHADKALGFIASETAIVERLDFFLPRKEKTIVITHRQVDTCAGLSTLWIGERDMKIAEMLISKFAVPSSETVISLSPREIDVLRLLAKGKQLKEIADMLCISVNTASTHRKNISAKLGIRSLSGLSLYAHINGLI